MSCNACEQRETNREFVKIYLLIVALAFAVNFVVEEITDIRRQIGQERSRRIELTDSVGFLREQFWASGIETTGTPKVNEEVEPSDG